MEQKALSRLTLDLPPELHRRLKVAAAVQGVSMKSLILAWIERGLKDTERK